MNTLRPTPVIDCSIECEGWAALEEPDRLAEAAICEAVETSGAELAEGAEISIVFCDDAFIRDLNRKWLGNDRPTNVLSFPTGGDPRAAAILGDIVIAFETTFREALEAGRSLRDHVSHLVVHGFLHLIGYDHVDDDDADKMEALERRILARLGIDDPYNEALDSAAH